MIEICLGFDYAVPEPTDGRLVLGDEVTHTNSTNQAWNSDVDALLLELAEFSFFFSPDKY